MKKKRIMTALLTTAMVFGAVPTAFAADNITVTVDGQKVSFGDQQPVNINGRVMVPVRAVAEKMGWDVSFEKYSTNDSPVVNGRFQEYNHVSLNKTVKEDKDFAQIIYVFLTIFLYLLKCPQSLILSALRAFCFCGKPHISRSIFLYFRYQAWLKSW